MLLGVIAQSACTNDAAESAGASEMMAQVAPEVHAPAAGWPLVLVHKTESCGCCTSWVEHLRANGFEVDVRNAANLAPVKERAGVPSGLHSCHTAEVGGYFIEGHVPAGDLARLLADRPEARGLAVPGMPLGSPGMDYQNEHEPYDVLLVHSDGTTTVFARYGQ
jgi:hypothetical protein